jgi:two-component system NarL family sensor kinase
MAGRNEDHAGRASEAPVKTPWLGRFHGFLVTSAVLIAVAVLSSGFVVGRFFEQQQLAHEEEHTTKVVQTQARQHLVPDDFGPPLPGRGGPVFAVFLRELPDVVRIKVYDRSGQVVWSDESRLIGLAFPDNPYLARALRGEVATVMQVPQGPEHVYEQAIPHVAETYVPITLPGRPELLGVVETYKDVTPFVLGIRRAQQLIWGIGGGVGLILYLAFAFVVWKASRNEQWAIRRLEAQNQELERAHRALREAQGQLVESERLAAVGQVVVSLHHGILNPLAGILGALQVIKQGGLAGAAQAEIVTQAEAEIRRIERLIRRLPALRRTVGTEYVGGATMLDLDAPPVEEMYG